jgi:hypothetical protein
MFDKIGRYAQTVATSAGQSRRGFLGLLGKRALGVASVVGGLLLLPGKARAAGTCAYSCPDGHTVFKSCACQPSITHGGMVCTLFYHSCPY